MLSHALYYTDKNGRLSTPLRGNYGLLRPISVTAPKEPSLSPARFVHFPTADECILTAHTLYSVWESRMYRAASAIRIPSSMLRF